MKVAQQPQKPLSGSNQIWDTTSDKKDTSQQPRLSPQSAREAPKKPAKQDSYKYLINFYYRKMCLHSRFYSTNVQKENKSIICDWKKCIFFISGSLILVITGYPSHGKTQVIDINSSSSSCSDLPRYPIDMWLSTGGMLSGFPINCGGRKRSGGYLGSSYLSSCYRQSYFI